MSSELKPDRAVQLHLRIEVADRDADIGGRGVQLVLGGADVGTPAGKFGGNAERNPRRPDVQEGSHAKLGLERARRLIQ